MIGFAKVTRDMTDRLRLAELQHARDLSAHVQAALEDERTSIARELHDDLGQQLASLKMQIAALDAERVGAGFARHSLRDTQGIQAQIDTVIASVRRIAAGLRPPVLDDLGLFAAIEWLVSDFRRRYGLAVTLDISGDEVGFGPDASTSVFRLVQEALTNVVRHADASKVRIAIRCAKDRYTLTIEDDGAGRISLGHALPTPSVCSAWASACGNSAASSRFRAARARAFASASIFRWTDSAEAAVDESHPVSTQAGPSHEPAFHALGEQRIQRRMRQGHADCGNREACCD